MIVIPFNICFIPVVSNVTCPSPDKTVTDGVLVSNKTVFRAGDKAIYKCNKADGTGKGERTCTAQGSWTYLGYVCDGTFSMNSHFKIQLT
jgi:hypothetical protein